MRKLESVSSQTTPSLIIFGKLIGRLSSFSNSAFILEQKGDLSNIVDNFSYFQYIKESLGAFYHGSDLPVPNTTYSHIMLDSMGAYYSKVEYTVMCGTQGILLLSLYKSPLAFFINLTALLVIINITFKLISLFRSDKLKDLIFFYFCSRLTGGMAQEYMNVLLFTAIYAALFLSINMLGHNSNIKPSYLSVRPAH
jgi:hypothetical protein